MLNKKDLTTIKEYVELVEGCIDGELGSCRETEQLSKEKAMPVFYYEILFLLGLTK